MKQRPSILLTNDDGIGSPGIYALYESLRQVANVTVIAPDSERSAIGHAITVSEPLRVTTVHKNGHFFGYATSGTPADCVKLGIMDILKKKPDLVASGINLGPNTGFGVIYSGTVSGATEGAILGIPSFAISLATFENPDFSFAAEYAQKIIAMIQSRKLPKGTALNVNIPAIPKERIKGVKVTRQSKTAMVERYDKREDPHGRTYYWLTGELLDRDGEPDSDVDAIRKGYVSITPLNYDWTDYSFAKSLKRLISKPSKVYLPERAAKS